MMEPDLIERLWRARDYLERYYSSPIRLDELAATACLSPYHFHRRYRELFGEPPGSHLLRRRLEEARRLITDSDMSITEISLSVGYCSLGSFSALFRRATGYSPLGYRRENRSEHYFFDLGYLFIPRCFLIQLRTWPNDEQMRKIEEAPGRSRVV
jgi:AraC-like DNA-binding protein